MPNFIQIDTKDDGPVLINADSILMIEEIRAGHCRLDFGAARFFDVDGPAADQIVQHATKNITLQAGSGSIKYPELAMPAPLNLPGVDIPRLPEWR